MSNTKNRSLVAAILVYFGIFGRNFQQQISKLSDNYQQQWQNQIFVLILVGP